MASRTITLTGYVPNLRDEALVLEALRSGVLVNGPMTGALEAALSAACGRGFAVSAASGPAGLRALLTAMSIGYGDEVIVSPFASPRMAAALAASGATPVLADIDPACLNIDAGTFVRAVSPRTRAVLFTQCFGNTRHASAVYEEASRRGVVLIEDAAEGVGSRVGDRRWVGGMGHASVVSFNAEGPLYAGGGGAVLTDDMDLADRLAAQREARPGGAALPQGLAMQPVGELRAALLVGQLRRLAATRDRMTALADAYMRLLVGVRGVILPTIPEDLEPLWTSLICRLEATYDGASRDRVLDYLRTHDVEAVAPRRCLHAEPTLAGMFEPGTRAPLAESVCGRLIRLPFHEGMGAADASIVVQTLSVAISRENLTR